MELLLRDPCPYCSRLPCRCAPPPVDEDDEAPVRRSGDWAPWMGALAANA